MNWLRSVRLVAPLVIACAGCSEDDASRMPPPVPLRECPELDYTTCDIRLPTCQARLLELSRCVVGAEDAPRVPVEVLTEAELRAELEAEADSETPEEKAEAAVIEGVLHALDLAAVGSFSADASIDTLVTTYDGLYRDAERGITVIDRGYAQNSVGYNALLVHELVHALQDAQYDLEATRTEFATSTDSLLALKAIIEGEATWYQYRVVGAMLGYDADTVDYPSLLEDLRLDMLDDVRMSKSPYIASFGTFPYAFGSNIMYQAWLARGQGFEADFFADPPRTTHEVVSRSLDLGLPLVEPREYTEPSASEDFSLLQQDSFGSFLFDLCFYKKGLDNVGWLGDQIWIYTNPDGDVAWLWEIEVDAAASAIAGAFEITLPSDVSVEAEGTRLFAVSNAEGAPFLLDAGRAFLSEGS